MVLPCMVWSMFMAAISLMWFSKLVTAVFSQLPQPSSTCGSWQLDRAFRLFGGVAQGLPNLVLVLLPAACLLAVCTRCVGHQHPLPWLMATPSVAQPASAHAAERGSAMPGCWLQLQLASTLQVSPYGFLNFDGGCFWEAPGPGTWQQCTQQQCCGRTTHVVWHAQLACHSLIKYCMRCRPSWAFWLVFLGT